jgi:hypothetical protein
VKIIPRHGPSSFGRDTDIRCIVLGLTVPLRLSFIVLFGCTVIQGYDTAKMLIFKATPNRENAELSLGELGIAGFLSAVPATAVAAPVERAKVLLQVCIRLSRTSYL